MNFPIPAEHCLIIKALHETESLREAARLLDMDPAHLTRKIQKIPENLNLVRKNGNRWVLTDLGKRLALWVNEGINSQQLLLEEKPSLRIACYTWLAEQLLIPHFSKLNSNTHNKFNWSFNVVAANLEQEIISGRAEFVITCHPPNDPLIAHKKFHPDPWLIVVPASWKKAVAKLKDEDLVHYLQSKPFLRLSSVDAEHMLGFLPKKNSDLVIDGVIGVRTAVIHELGWSCLPSYSLTSHLKNAEVHSLNLPSATKGDLSIWWLRSRKDFTDSVKFISKWVSEIAK